MGLSPETSRGGSVLDCHSGQVAFAASRINRCGYNRAVPGGLPWQSKADTNITMTESEQHNITWMSWNILFKHPLATVGAILGAFGIVNLIDIAASRVQGEAWSFIPSYLRPLFQIFRDSTRPLIDFLSGIFGLEFKAAYKDYCVMGLITAGMRVRSTLVIRRWVLEGHGRSYKEQDLPFDLIVDNSSSRSTWLLFFAFRALYAFALWPIKLFGASWRYLSGKKRISGTGNGAEQLTAPQYEAFFATVAWALIIILLILMTRFGS